MPCTCSSITLCALHDDWQCDTRSVSSVRHRLRGVENSVRQSQRFADSAPYVLCVPSFASYQKLQAVLDIAAPSSVVADKATEAGPVTLVGAVELLQLLTPRAQQYVAGGNGQDVPGTLSLLRALQVRARACSLPLSTKPW